MKIYGNINRFIFKAIIIFAGLNLLITGSLAKQSQPSKNQIILPDFAELVKSTSPAVVSIQAVKLFDKSSAPALPDDSINPLPVPENNIETDSSPDELRSDTSGSGFIISPDGLIITNHHVIEDALRIIIHHSDRDYSAKVLGVDSANDIALLKIESKAELPYLKLADSDKVNMGDWLMVIGSPLGLSNSVSVGIVSTKGRSINITPDSSLESFIQTDAAINFGNSGGPLINLNGEVIGVATAVNFGSESIGFAVPSNIVSYILPQLKENGKTRRGYIGTQVQSVDADIAEAFGLNQPTGVLIEDVMSGSPAKKAGLKHGDIILAADKKEITDNSSLINYISSLKPGTKTRLEVFRNNQSEYYDIVVEEREPIVDSKVESNDNEHNDDFWPGLKYETIYIHDQQFVQVTDINPLSYFYDKNVRSQDIIREVNGKTLNSANELHTILESTKSGELLKLYLINESSQGFYAIVRAP
ncbi:MAG: trypsin-like peptidase domain-containing protein [Xanthomonadales bacterium]|jgi:serine protease Do|nr:trypsin-like peptidase domain-containing protein [Xanthomonadales bacterium]